MENLDKETKETAVQGAYYVTEGDEWNLQELETFL